MLEMILCLLGVIMIAAFGLNRRKKERFSEGQHKAELICEVAFYDRSVTLPMLEEYFEAEAIDVLDLKRNIQRKGGIDLFTNTYKLHLPKELSPAEMVNHFSEFSTVQSVQVKPL